MSIFDRAGNLLKGFLRKPVQALEDKLASATRNAPRSVADEELSALERAREAVREAEILAEGKADAGAAGPVAKPAPPAPPAAGPAPGKKTPRSMGPDE